MISGRQVANDIAKTVAPYSNLIDQLLEYEPVKGMKIVGSKKLANYAGVSLPDDLAALYQRLNHYG
jgi:hypothetical protein